MTTVDYFLICENAILAKNDKVSVVNIFDGINVSKFPAVPTKFALAFSMKPDDADVKDNLLEFSISIDDPKGVTILTAKGGGDALVGVDGRRNSLVTVTDFAGKFAFTSEGLHKIHLSLKGKKPFFERKFKVTLRENGGAKK
jgi:hypothetical protein